MPALALLPRSTTTTLNPADSDTTTVAGSPIYIAGIIVALAIGLGVAAWLTVRFYRRRATARREASRGAAFLSVKGIVREGSEKDPFATTGSALTKTFSRNNLNSSIIFPEKTLTPRPHQTRDEIIRYHRESGNFPAPFKPKPFAFTIQEEEGNTDSAVTTPTTANSASAPQPTPSTYNFLALPDLPSFTRSRNSFLSILSNTQNRFSVMSTLSSTSTSTTTGTNGQGITNITTGTLRKVRQVFDPVLPDELLVGQGETVRVMQSFDDGWCVVGRETTSFMHHATTSRSLFKPSAAGGSSLQPPPPAMMVDGSNVELGVVPAWCFLKPVKGLKAERPVRCSSLGVTVNLMDGPGVASRNDLVSWSNF